MHQTARWCILWCFRAHVRQEYAEKQGKTAIQACRRPFPEFFRKGSQGDPRGPPTRQPAGENGYPQRAERIPHTYPQAAANDRAPQSSTKRGGEGEAHTTTTTTNDHWYGT